MAVAVGEKVEKRRRFGLNGHGARAWDRIPRFDDIDPLVAQTLWTPERKLMAAVLEDAVHTMRTRDGSRIAKDAKEWVEATDWKSPFSFVNICQALGFHVGWMRAKIAASLTRWRAG